MKRRNNTLAAWAAAHEFKSILLLSGLSVLLFYGYSITAGFAPYDDPIQIVGNPAVHSIGASLKYFTTPVSFTSDLRSGGESFYRPLYWLSLAFDASVGGLSPALFHATNLLLQWFNCVLLFFLLRRLSFSQPLAIGTVLVWSVLPVNSEAVAWIAGRAYCLSAFFILIGLLIAQRYMVAHSRKYLFAYFAAAIFALLSHEQGILLLPLTALIAVANNALASRRAAALYSGALAADAGYFLLRHAVGVSNRSYFGAVSSLGLFLGKYLAWMVLPIRMSIERSTDTPAPGWSYEAIGAWVAVALVVAACVIVRRKRPHLFLGIAWMFLCLLPYSGLLPLYQGVAERFVYLASIGLVICVCSLCADTPQATRRFAIGAVALWAVWGIVRLQARISDWRDPVRLYQSSLQATPRSFKLHYDLGALFEEQGQYGDAMDSYKAALNENNRYEPALAGLGNAYLQLDEPEKASRIYEQALALKNNDVKTLTNYGTSLQKLGLVADAEREYRRAIELGPADDAAYCDLAVLLFNGGAADAAETLLQQAIHVSPNDSLPYANLAAIYMNTGRPSLALPLYKKDLELNPNDSSALAAMQSLSSSQ